MVHTLALTTTNAYTLQIEESETDFTVIFPNDNRSCPTHLHRNIRRALRFTSQGECYSFSEFDTLSLKKRSYEIALEVDTVSILMGWIRTDKKGTGVETIYSLSPIESRYFARNNRLLETKVKSKTIHTQTDLHSHFAGAIRADDLIRIAIENGIEYPGALLAHAGIKGYESENIRINELPEAHLTMFRESLKIPEYKQITFKELELIYHLRSPLTKSLELFIPILEQIAADYSEMGITYCELSFTDIVQSYRLELLSRELARIEKEYTLTIRFLGAIGRRDDTEWDEDYIERLKELKECPWIVGVDFLGHELNSTRVIAPLITRLAAWADEEKPAFTIRVHAGENPAHSENIRLALEALQGYKVQVRIGHGLYGCDRETIQLLQSTKAVVEFNLNSNYALNNITDCNRLPFSIYTEHGIGMVLGSDGYGIYQTSLPLEVKAALLSGVPQATMDRIIETEREILRSLSTGVVPYSPPPPMQYNRFSETVVNERRNREVSTFKYLIDSITHKGIAPITKDELYSSTIHTRVISFAGAWKKSWELISEEHKEKIKSILTDFLGHLNPQEFVLITGGTSLGLEGLVHDVASPLGFTIIGIIVRDLAPETLDERISSIHICGDEFYSKAETLYTFLQEVGGLSIFIGGGDIVADEIQTAHNMGIEYLLMKGPKGAANNYTAHTPQRSFETAKELRSAVLRQGKWESEEGNYWHLGVNPTVDAVVIRSHPYRFEKEILLIKRRSDALTEPGKWALPGGFIHTDAPKNTPWEAGYESPEEACLRELMEETTLDLISLRSDLHFHFDVENIGRDPRDTEERWSRTSVFSLQLDEKHGRLPICGADDAELAMWCLVSELPWNLAFDHREIIERVLSEIA